jgi:hypothetical protein
MYFVQSVAGEDHRKGDSANEMPEMWRAVDF